MSRKSVDDAELLNRLNALKPSSVQLEKRKELYDNLEEYDAPGETHLSDLTARFSGLRTSPSHHNRDALDVTDQSDDDINGLISELRDQSSDRIKDHLRGGENADDLLKDAKHFVETSSRLQDEAKSLGTIRDTVPEEQRRISQMLSDDDEAEEAEEYLQRVLDGLKSDGLRNALDEAFPSPADGRSHLNDSSSTGATKGTEAETTPIDLPSVPSTTSFRPPSSMPASDELSPLNLPSAPTAIPVTAKDFKATERPCKKDEPSWCCICSDGATINCLDCESNNLYCLRCWIEYHLTEGGPEERVHRREKYAKKA
ncbi:hypothetical protein KEM54_003710 [Ascosphaera aggregata]|nr:hypothetical protein KEM54_003710 [Ascosphaera aggregata]